MADQQYSNLMCYLLVPRPPDSLFKLLSGFFLLCSLICIRNSSKEVIEKIHAYLRDARVQLLEVIYHIITYSIYF
jgi:uncharacterized protein YlzI (FlbEa/FlbD family)